MILQDAIFTVGHSNHALDVFLGLLRRHGISAVADVRSAPFSRRFPQFDKPALSRSLKDARSATCLWERRWARGPTTRHAMRAAA